MAFAPNKANGHHLMSQKRIDDTVLALLYLGRHETSRMTDEVRTWKTFDWDVMNRLYEKGLITDPVNKNKAVAFTEEGLKESERLFRELFETPDVDE